MTNRYTGTPTSDPRASMYADYARSRAAGGATTGNFGAGSGPAAGGGQASGRSAAPTGSADALERQAVARQLGIPEWAAARVIREQVNQSRIRRGLAPIGTRPAPRPTVPGTGRGGGSTATPANPGTGTVTLPPNNTYSPAPAPLSAEDLAEFDTRRIALDSLLADAEANLVYGTEAANAQAIAQSRGLLRDAGSARRQGIGELSSRGLGLSPAASGRLMNAIMERQAAGLSGVEQARLGNILDLSQRRDQAAKARNEGYAAINRLIALRGGSSGPVTTGGDGDRRYAFGGTR